MDVSLYYDSLLAKLIVWGPDRDTAIARSLRALREFTITGVRTTVPFAEFALSHPRFIAGDLSLGFISETWTAESAAGPIALDVPRGTLELSAGLVVALAAALTAAQNGPAATPIHQSEATPSNRWRDAGRAWQR
jgi:acetyl/propionyl-CoA carboxylase alpha subunit